MMLLPLLAISAAVQLQPPPAYDFKQVWIAAQGERVAATFASQNKVMFSGSPDGGKTWSEPRLVAQPGIISAGRHRGPRVAAAGGSLIISVVAGEKGGGQDGDLLTFRSTDFGATWTAGPHVNDVSGSAREGLHSMAGGPDGLLYAAWLDLRKTGTHLYGAVSTDAGVTWSKNAEIYASPSGTICQCCHPSVAIAPNGSIAVMWRNALDGNRDLYLMESADRGQTFSAARKLGTRSWKIDACPMDGGGLAFEQKGRPASVWRRENTIYLARPGEAEQAIQTGKDPVIAETANGTYLAWRGEPGIQVRAPGHDAPTLLDPDGQYPELLALPGGKVLAAWEAKGQIRFQLLPQ